MKKRIVSMMLAGAMVFNTNIATMSAFAQTESAGTSVTEVNVLEGGAEEADNLQLSEISEQDTYQASKKAPAKVSLNKVKLKNKKAVLSWKKQKDVSGYEVYMSKTEHGTYKKIKTIKNPATTSYTTGILANNTVYYFKIRAYKSTKGKKTYGEYSSLRSVARGKAKVNPANLKSATIKNKKAVLTWSRQDSVSGYEIYMAKSKNGPYKNIKTIKKCKTTSYTTGTLAEGITYYFKVRPYKTVSGKRVYGNYSGVKTVKREVVIDKSNKGLLQSYFNKTLVPKYGLFDSHQEGIKYELFTERYC